jgi:hypothetical protein
MIKPAVVKEVPLNLSSEGQEERFEAIMKVAKRLSLLIRELEVTSLDVAMYAKTLSKGNFPRSYVKDTQSQLYHAITEIQRISKLWDDTFLEVKND